MLKKLFLTATLLLSLSTLHAKEKSKKTQPSSLKIGYANVDYIVTSLPEVEGIMSECESLGKQLNNKIEASMEELRKKEQALEQDAATMNEAQKKKKVIELQQLSKGLKRLQLESQEKLKTKYDSLLTPLYDKAQATIAQVAKEKGYTHIFNANLGGVSVLIYADEGHDISDWVLKKLGINPEKQKAK